MPKKTKFKQSKQDWKAILSNQGITYSELAEDLSIFADISENCLGRWIRGDIIMPSIIYGYLVGRFLT